MHYNKIKEVILDFLFGLFFATIVLTVVGGFIVGLSVLIKMIPFGEEIAIPIFIFIIICMVILLLYVAGKELRDDLRKDKKDGK